MPLAPGRLSITTCWPMLSLSFCARIRPRMSVMPPAPAGMTMRTGRDGYCCALVAVDSAQQQMRNVERGMWKRMLRRYSRNFTPTLLPRFHIPHSTLVLHACSRLLPVLAVEELDRHALDRAGIEAAGVDAVAVGVGARNVERFYAADRTEQVLGGAGIECIGGEDFAAAHQFEAVAGHDEMQEPDPAADRAVALGYGDVGGSTDLEAYPPAVTAAGVRDHCSLVRFWSPASFPVRPGRFPRYPAVPGEPG